MRTKRKSKPPATTTKVPAGMVVSDSRKPDVRARLATTPELNAALVIDAFDLWPVKDADKGDKFNATVCELYENGGAVVKGSTGNMERALFCQAQALEAVFTKLARKAAAQDYLPQYEAFMKLALRAQNQSRMTLETLATIKNPPVVFAKQANMGQNVQVNNGTRAQENAKPQPKLSRPNHDGQPLDYGTPAQTGRSDTAMETVETLNGAKDNGRQSEGEP